jgi:hypothetical protein
MTDLLKPLLVLTLLGSDVTDGQVAAVLALLLLLLVLAFAGVVAVFRWRRPLLSLALGVGLALLEPLRLLGGAPDSST